MYDEKNIIANNFSRIAKENNLLIDTCAEDIELSKYNIAHARCIDDRLIAKLIGYNFIAEKDKNQRLECCCVGSIDIGEYNSCSNSCVYCYANYSKGVVRNNVKKHNQFSPLLIGEINEPPQGRALRYLLTFMFYSDMEIIPTVFLHVFFDSFPGFSPDFSHIVVLLSHLHVPPLSPHNIP